LGSKKKSIFRCLLEIKVMAIKILTNAARFLNQLKEDLKRRLKPRLRQAADGLRNELSEKIPQWIESSLDYFLLKKKRNRVELGITEEQLDKAMEDVAELIIQSIRVEITSDPGGLKLSFDERTLAGIKDLPSGEYISENGHLVEWLDWLVNAGSRVVVEGHHFTDMAGEGRIGGGVMWKGGVWRVPLEIRGDQSENFVTRIMDKKTKEMYRLMRGHLLGEKARLRYQ
jgi:hypothetical protein